VYVRRVAGDEDPADPEPLGQPDVRAPHRRPGQVAELRHTGTGVPIDKLLQSLDRRVGVVVSSGAPNWNWSPPESGVIAIPAIGFALVANQ
jgi:hypothetical protein